MMTRLMGRVAIVTGAAQGIGYATAHRFWGEGATVYAADLRPSRIPGVEDVSLDVERPSSWAELAERIDARHGRLDILVNNAGIGSSPPEVASEDLDAWNPALGVNLSGVYLGMKAVVPLMRASGRGAIVNVSSVWGVVGADPVESYGAMQGAVRNLSRHAARSYAADGIRVNSVHPGVIDTAMVAAQSSTVTEMALARTPLGRKADPSEVAAAILYLASDEASFVTGAELAVDGGFFAQ